MTDIRIYQIDLDRDHDGVAFEPYASLSRWQDSPDVNASLYETVFKGEIEAKDRRYLPHLQYGKAGRIRRQIPFGIRCG